MKKILASGLSTALALSVALPVLADDDTGTSYTSNSSSSSVSSSSSDTVSSSSSSPGKPGDRMMKAKEKANRSVTKPAVDTACAQTAVAKREAALAAAADAHYASMKAAMTTRAAALAAAWGQADQKTREAAIRAAHTAFKTSAKTAHTAARTARLAAWKTFKTDAKACKIAVPKVESDDEKTDTAL